MRCVINGTCVLVMERDVQADLEDDCDGELRADWCAWKWKKGEQVRSTRPRNTCRTS